jgi:uncharacterized membrane-anchored protein
MYRAIAFLSFIVVLALVNWTIYQKELHVKNGTIVYLKLAPVDPRSLMQGDYMALEFDIARKIYHTLPKKENRDMWKQNVDAKDGQVVVHLDSRNVASFVRLYEGKALKENELLLDYHVRNGAVKFASNAFFFEEGSAKKYEKAKYGEFRVNEKGELLLVAMADRNIKILK